MAWSVQKSSIHIQEIEDTVNMMRKQIHCAGVPLLKILKLQVRFLTPKCSSQGHWEEWVLHFTASWPETIGAFSLAFWKALLLFPMLCWPQACCRIQQALPLPPPQPSLPWCSCPALPCPTQHWPCWVCVILSLPQPWVHLRTTW